MRAWPSSFLLACALAPVLVAVTSLSCTKTEEDAEPTVTESAEPAEGGVPALDLWAGVPPLTAEPDDIATKLEPRPSPLPPPSSHETIEVPLKAPEDGEGPTAPPPDPGPLEVERHGPTGAQSIVDAVRLSFNQPMVPLADVTTLSTASIPFTVEPAVPGGTQWLGTRTLAFVPESGRMPFSTKYTVTVPAGVKSTWGNALASDFRFAFSTPTLALESSTPWDESDDVTLEPTITLEFNQAVERTAIIGAMTLSGGGDRMGLRLAPPPKTGPATATPTTEPEWKAARRVEVIPERTLRPNTRYTLSIPAGTYGEGPIASKTITTHFRTYPPLTLKKAKCWGTCYANNGITIESSTQLSDPDIASKVHVSPEPANFSVNPQWSGIVLSGEFEGRTRYTVTVDAGLRDLHGQTLAREFKTTTTLGPPYPSVSPTSSMGNPVVIERAASKDLELLVAGVKNIELRARSMKLAAVPDFLDAYPYDSERQWPQYHDPPTYTKLFATPDAMRRTERVSLDLSPALDPGDGHLWLDVRSNPVRDHGWTQRYGLHALVEVTDLGVATALDGDSGLVMVTRLSNGEPVESAKLELRDRSGKTLLWSGTTDEDGLARMTAGAESDGALLTVEHGDDSALLRVEYGDLRGRYRYPGMSTDEDTPRAFFFTDRTPYKPGDTVHLAGILRQETRGPKGGVKLWLHDFPAEYQVTNPRGVEVAKGTVKLGALGTFSVDIPTKEEHGTGDFSFTLTVSSLFGSDQRFYHSFPVETYRAPEFTVSVDRDDSKPLVFGDRLVAKIHGDYLHGAPLSGGEVTWTLQRSQTGFSPPGALNEGFHFGIASSRHGPLGYGGGYGRGFQRYGRGHRGGYYDDWGGGWGPSFASTTVAQGTGALDALGVSTVEHELLAIEPPPEGTPAPDPTTKPEEDEGPPPPSTFTLEATVVDDNRQAIAGQGSFVVHAARVYVGLRAEQTVLREGQKAKLEAVLVDLEGERVADRDVALTLLRRETTRTAVERGGRWIYETETKEVEAGRCALTSALVPATCELPVGTPGTYLVRGTAEDADGNATRSQIQVYVHGKDSVVWESTERRVDLVPDRVEYAPGDTATVLVRSPFDEARGVVVVEREGIALELPVVVEGGATIVEIPIDDTMLPSVSVSALLTRGRAEVPGAPKGQDLGMPAAATGTVQLPVSTDAKKIAIELTPSAKELAPGDTMTLELTTTTAKGEALPAAVAVMVVDEGVLSLMGHQTPDPLAFFHHPRTDGVWMYALQAAVLARDVPPPAGATGGGAFDNDDGTGEGTIGLGNMGLIGRGAGGGGSGYGRGSGGAPGGALADSPDQPAAPMEESRARENKQAPKRRDARAAPLAKSSSSMRSKGGESERATLDPSLAMAQPVSLREVFATTAFYQAEVLTDASGKATLAIPMPENLTTFRVMAVAVDPAQADRFGKGDTTVRIRKPLMLRPSLPRFANFGDRFEASVMVDNQTGADQAVLVGTRGLNVSLPGEAQTMVEIPAGQSREVRFDMATQQVGTMRLQFAALSNGGRDATELSLPVHYPATAEAFADYGMIEGATERTVVPPAEALPEFGGLELSMSSTALSGLEDAVDYLVTYPYECAEQTASRLLPIFALSKILDDFPVASLRDVVYRNHLAADGIRSLLDKQNYDGGFGYWTSRHHESWPYLTNWVTFALLEGKRAGYTVDEEALRRALNYVENFVTYGHRTRWGTYYDWTSRAMGLWILSGEKRGSALFDRVWAHRKEMPLYAHALLMAAAHRYGRTTARDQVLDELRDAAIESPRAMHFAEGKSEADVDGLRVLMHSSVQTDAIALIALLEAVPGDPMLPKVMAGIMSGRDPKQGGRWGTTHANAWALVAADRYYRSVEADEPDFTARVWLDEQLSGEQRFEGRSMASAELRLAMAELLENGGGKPERSLVLGKEGTGKLYYRMGLRYAPKDLVLPAVDQGFEVHRTYEALAGAEGKPDASAVQQLPDGGWQVKAGTNVKVTLTIVARDRANYVVIDDALPAGFEGQNPRFRTSVAATSEASRTVSADHWWWPWWSFDHTDLRDDRMLLFSDSMPAGVYTYSYTARATTLGTFVLPPIKAEAMYEPERFGHSSTATVRVVE
ncbi:Ig-like domain-containing alpha-2-macroglobulin family protein [Paraliomyxa miuraensis]|uniref:Ig-like domain-containing alpha-2-macroglobulin family protein n=1 Tax=Paraliomyxa miuraensis TaxID=376150 RepID=UPI002257336B|nr:Ig-like domain-containing alpha-2-macroglobulin family protein [Paraliomyxa miuraensis]MCX4242699.1 Ig-like domain-containing protein [Paraliomyxa miuraensis]